MWDQCVSALCDVCWGWSFYDGPFSYMPDNSAKTAGSWWGQFYCSCISRASVQAVGGPRVPPTTPFHVASPPGKLHLSQGSSKGEKSSTHWCEKQCGTKMGESLGQCLEISYHSLLEMCPPSPPVQCPNPYFGIPLSKRPTTFLSDIWAHS